jgi:RNA polymerase sigma-70 factor (family 1)
VRNFNDYELVIRLRQDDLDAFDTFYERYHRGLYFNILKLTKDPDTAQDILQEVFLTLWEKRLTLDPDHPLPSWLFVVAYNKSINHLRKNLRRSVSLEGAESELKAVREEEEEISVEDRAQLLTEAISQLSPQKRRVLELCKLQGKSYEETAQEMHISRHTVKEYLSMAIAHIKLYIRQHGTMLLFIYFQPFFLLLLS